MNPKNSPIWLTDTKTLREIVANSKSRIEVLRSLGLRPFGSNYSRLDERIRTEGISLDHFYHQSAGVVRVNRARRQPLRELLIENSNYNKQRLKERILQEGLLPNKCNICGLEPNWVGKKLSMILDHKNGKHNDDRLENLQLVCPNCNSQLPTHCGKNRKAVSNSKRCETCAKVISTGKRCKPCAAVARRKIKNRPTKEQLLLDIKNTNYQTTAKKYGVCNATIKKWIFG